MPFFFFFAIDRLSDEMSLYVFCHFLIDLLPFLLSSFEFIPNVSLFFKKKSDIWFAYIFSQFVAHCFHPLNRVFHTIFLVLIKFDDVQFINFYFMEHAFGV